MNPAVLDADTILAIHRHDDGQIAISRKNPDGSWDWLWMLTPGMLRGTFRAFKDWLIDGGHFSTQAYFRPAPGGWVHKPTGLPAIGADNRRPPGDRRFGRVTENLRYLNCFSLDIDCGRTAEEAKTELETVPWRTAQRRVEDLQDAGIVPPISMYGFSGRGLYVIWLLHDDKDPARSAKAYDHHVPTWKAIQKELVRRVETAPLPVDHSGSLITQVYKIGGTTHPKTRKRAAYFITAQADKDRRLISYTLTEMAHHLSVLELGDDLPESVQQQVKRSRYRRLPKTRNPKCANGYRDRHGYIAADMLTLLNHRLQDGSGGWQKRNQAYADGHRSPKYGRRMILALFATALVRSIYSPKQLRPPATIDPGTRSDILGRLRRMAERCSPAWPDEPGDGGDQAFDRLLDSILAQYRPQKDGVTRLPPMPSTRTLLAAFGVTSEMARTLDLKTIVPDDIRDERHRGKPTQKEIVQARRQWLLDYLHAHPSPGAGGRWTCRKVYEALSPFAPHPWNNRETANQDLNAIGYRYRNTRTRKAYTG